MPIVSTRPVVADAKTDMATMHRWKAESSKQKERLKKREWRPMDLSLLCEDDDDAILNDAVNLNRSTGLSIDIVEA